MEDTTGPVTVRPARLEDVVRYRDLRLEALLNHPDAFSGDYAENLKQPMEYWRGRVESTINSPDTFLVFSEAGEELVGMCGLQLGKSPKIHHAGTIFGVYVRPAWRGHNLTGQMIERCLEWGAAQQARVVYLGVNVQNTPAIRAYARCGFTVYGVEPEAIGVEGVYYDELLMYRRISNPT